MRSRLALCLVALSFLFEAGSGCQGDAIEIVSPSAGAEIRENTVPVQINIQPEAVQPGSMVATLNGVPLPLSGGPRSFTAVVNADFPLREENLLSVGALYTNGVGIRIEQSFRYAPPEKP